MFWQPWGLTGAVPVWSLLTGCSGIGSTVNITNQKSCNCLLWAFTRESLFLGKRSNYQKELPVAHGMSMAHFCCCQDAEQVDLRPVYPAWLSCGLYHPVQAPAAPVQWTAESSAAGTLIQQSASAQAQAREWEQDQQLHLENRCWSCRNPDCFILTLCIASYYSSISWFSDKFGVLCC